MKHYTLSLCAVLSAAAVAIASCSAPTEEEKDSLHSHDHAHSEEDHAHEHAHDHEHEHEHGHDHGGHSHEGFEAEEGETEVAQLPTRIVISHADGLRAYDAKTGKVIGEDTMNAFLRLSDAGDNRHVMVTKGDSFLTYDTGRITKGHGDHNHYYLSLIHI